jgi:hypothetical protein
MHLGFAIITAPEIIKIDDLERDAKQIKRLLQPSQQTTECE